MEIYDEALAGILHDAYTAAPTAEARASVARVGVRYMRWRAQGAHTPVPDGKAFWARVAMREADLAEVPA